jgi:DNA-binding SARP family transcriptional activator/predicted ATPase
MRLDLTLFGSPRAVRAGAPLRFPRRKTLALLAYLAATGQPHGRDALGALFWPEADQSQARGNLRHTLSELRQVAGPDVLTTEGEQVVLTAGAAEVDVATFHGRLAEVAAHRHDQAGVCDGCLAALATAVGLYRGDFLAGFSLRDAPDFDTWQTYQSEALRLELAVALEKLATGLAARRQVEQALPLALRWLALDPPNEVGHRLLMRLYAATGDRSAVARQYAQCQHVLASELGIEPARETTELHRDLLREEPAPSSMLPMTGEHLPAAPSLTRLERLPPDPTPFIGRERELALIAGHLSDSACRLVTVIGPGGIGKTRLVIQAARMLADQFPDGVCFVDLSAIASLDLLDVAIVQTLQLGLGTENPHQHLIDFLRDRRLLLLLDNFEHLAYGAARLSALLTEAPRLVLLVTSRVRLNLREECLLPLTGLELPPASGQQLPTAAELAVYSAPALFLQSVRRLFPAFAPDAAALVQIERICRLLDGAPLALELAAAWVRALPLEEVGAELMRGHALLTTSLKDVPERHRSMRATFDSSWRLLAPDERSILRQLAVFNGGFTRAAAQGVTGAGLVELVALGDASWLRLEVTGRYSLHELVRQYCAERLAHEHHAATGASPTEMYRRHAEYYVAYLDRYAPEVNRDPAAMAQLAAERANLEAAWEWLVDHGEPETIGRTALALGEVAEIAGWYRSMADAYAAAVPRLKQRAATGGSWVEGGTLALVHVLTCESQLLFYLDDVDRAEGCVAECLALLPAGEAGPRWEGARLTARNLLAQTYSMRGQHGAAVQLSRELLTGFRLDRASFWPFVGDAGAYAWLADVHHNLSDYLDNMGDTVGRRAPIEQAIHYCELAGRRVDSAYCLQQLSRILLMTGDYRGAQQLATEALQTFDAFGEKGRAGMALFYRARSASLLDEWAQARADGERCLALARESGLPSLFMYAYDILGRVELSLGHLAEAKRLFAEGLSAASAAGSAAVQFVPLVTLSEMGLAEHDPNGAMAWLSRALHVGPLPPWETAVVVSLIGYVLVQQGQYERAASLLACVEMSAGATIETREKAAQWLKELGPRVASDDSAASVARGRALDIDDVLRELRAEL